MISMARAPPAPAPPRLAAGPASQRPAARPSGRGGAPPPPACAKQKGASRLGEPAGRSDWLAVSRARRPPPRPF